MQIYFYFTFQLLFFLWFPLSVLSCGQFCQRCSNATFCTKCQTGYELRYETNNIDSYNISCYRCSLGSYYNPYEFACSKCQFGCGNCSTGTFCSNCKTNYRRTIFNNSGTLETKCTPCKVGTFLNTTSDRCEKCPLECIDCSATNCTACKANYGNNFVCQPVGPGLDNSGEMLASGSFAIARLSSIGYALGLIFCSFREETGGAFYLTYFIYQSFYFSIRFISLDYSSDVLEYFDISREKISLKIGFTKSVDFDIDPITNIPENFQTYAPSSRFFVNYIDTIITMFMFMLIGFIAMAVRKLIKFEEESMRKYMLWNFEKSMKWTFVLAILVANYDEIIIYGFLELFSFSSDGTFSSISKALFFIFAVVSLASLIVMMNVLLKVRKSRLQIVPKSDDDKVKKSKRNPIVELKGFQIIFRGFQPGTMFSEMHFLFYCLRIFVWNMVITYGYTLGRVQVFILGIMSITYIIYLIISRPYTNKTLLITSIFYEFLLFATFLCLLMASLADRSPDDTTNDPAGTAAIVLVCAYPIIAFIFLIGQFIHFIIYSKRNIKKLQSTDHHTPFKEAVLQHFGLDKPDEIPDGYHTPTPVQSPRNKEEEEEDHTPGRETPAPLLAQTTEEEFNARAPKFRHDEIYNFHPMDIIQKTFESSNNVKKEGPIQLLKTPDVRPVVRPNQNKFSNLHNLYELDNLNKYWGDIDFEATPKYEVKESEKMIENPLKFKQLNLVMNQQPFSK